MERLISRARAGLAGFLFVSMLDGCVSTYAGSLARGDALSDQGQWAEAEAYYQRALAERPNDEEARTKLRVARWNHGKAVAGQAEQALARGETMRGLKLASEAMAIDAAVPETQRVHERASTLALDAVERTARAGQKREALALAVEVRAEIPRDERAARVEAGLRDEVALESYERADAQVKRGMPGNALLSLAEAERVKPGFRDAQGRALALRERLVRELRFHLVVAETTAASPLSRGLADELRRLGPSDARPLLVVASDAPEGAQGVRLEPSLGDVQREHRALAEPRSCSYVCGVDRRPNPARDAAARRADEAERRLRAADDETTRLRQALRQAQQREDTSAAALKVAASQLDRAQAELKTCQNAAPSKDGSKDKGSKDKDGSKDKGGKDKDSGKGKDDKDGKGKDPRADRKPCGREQERLREAQREVDERKAAVEVARSERTRAEGDESRGQQEARRARKLWEGEVAELGRTPAILEIPRSCQHAFNAEIHTVIARSIHDLKARPLGRVQASRPASEVLVSSSDETFAPQERCGRAAAAGDPLTLPAEATLDQQLLLKASAEARAAVGAWYDSYASDFQAEADRASRAGRTEEATEWRVRHRLLTGRPLEG